MADKIWFFIFVCISVCEIVLCFYFFKNIFGINKYNLYHFFSPTGHRVSVDEVSTIKWTVHGYMSIRRRRKGNSGHIFLRLLQPIRKNLGHIKSPLQEFFLLGQHLREWAYANRSIFIRGGGYHFPQIVVINRFFPRSNDWTTSCVSPAYQSSIVITRSLGQGCKVAATIFRLVF